MSGDPLSSSGGHGAADESREHAHSPNRASIPDRLARLARVAVLAALGLGIAVLSVDGNQQAPLSALMPPTAAPSVAQAVEAPEVALAYAAVAAPVPDAPLAATSLIPAAQHAAEASIEADVAVEPAADEAVADQDELIRELRPQLSARGGSRAEAAPVATAEATPVPALAMQEMSASAGLQANPPTPAPTKVPTKAPTPKPAPTKAPTPKPVATTVTSGALGQRVVSIALRYVGYRYTSGGTSPSTGFDCSGFVYYVFRSAGYPLSRDIFAQYRTGVAVSRSSLLPGDRVYFQNTYRYGLSHASIYIGGGRIVHAQSESTGVTISSLGDRYWSSHYLGARRD